MEGMVASPSPARSIVEVARMEGMEEEEGVSTWR